MIHNATVFPYTKEILPIVRHARSLQNYYDIQSVLAWNGTGLIGRDASHICNQPSISIPVEKVQADALAWDTVLVDAKNMNNTFSIINEKNFITRCLECGKKVVLFDTNYSECLKQFILQHEKYTDKIVFIAADRQVDDTMNLVEDSQYNLLNIPVILVGSLTDNCDSLEVALALKEKFIKNGHTVSCLTNSNISILLGAYSYQHIFSNRSFTEADKILHLNQFANDIVRLVRPELLIVHAPDPVMKFNDRFPNGFGIRTYMAIQAFSPNLFVCCIPYNLAISGFIETISQGFFSKYGLPFSAVHINNALIDNTSSYQNQALPFLHVPMELVSKVITDSLDSCSIPVFDTISQGAEKLYQHLCWSLSLLEG